MCDWPDHFGAAPDDLHVHVTGSICMCNEVDLWELGLKRRRQHREVPMFTTHHVDLKKKKDGVLQKLTEINCHLQEARNQIYLQF